MSITIRRMHRPHSQFTQISNTFLRAPIGSAAHQVACYVLSHEETFILTRERIAKVLEMGVNTVSRAIHELEERGYLISQEVRNERGYKVGSALVISDEGFTEEERETLNTKTVGRPETLPTKTVDTKTVDTVLDPHKKTIFQEDLFLEEDHERSATSAPPTRRTRSTPLPDSWEPTPAHTDKATELGVDVEYEAESMRLWATSKDERKVDWDQAFHLWLRRSRRPGSSRVVSNGDAYDEIGRLADVSSQGVLL